MGGLVIKRAYILAKQKEESVSLADQVEAMFFLATTHRGSDLATIFSKLLNLSGGARPFVTDLHHVLRSRLTLTKRELSEDQRRLLDSFLGVSDAPEDDFMSVDSVRMSGSCEWLIKKKSFQQWLHHGAPPIYWISAKPATGKTIPSGKIIAYLRELHANCSFYFFQHGNRENKRHLISLIYSVADGPLEQGNSRCCPSSLRERRSSQQGGLPFIWRKLFLEGIFKANFDQTHYWVVDALGECKTKLEIVPLLTKVVQLCSIRILLTSRNTNDSCRRVGLPKVRVASEQIQEEDSRSDIALYLKANVDELPSVDEKGQQHVVRQILEKSAGCFLWVSLVFQELRKVHTSTDVQKTLDEIPTDMNELFAHILDSMSTASYGKSLAKVILTWTLQMIHLTARDSLLNSTDSEFAVDEKDGHRRLLMTCLQYLSGDETKGARRRKLSASNTPKERSSFVSYASNSLIELISHQSSTDDDILFTLARFFGSPNVLS
ncbi:hypothetical protein N7G274_010914 [Stereocaulon virgatum]|uniref:Nephrocystin 3-like N-terminal domain-containing protein n=1 Tax=Stereocaulon virgatum TaxID=373712 RepID=A0ABR3ZSP6_9LECA